MPVAVVAVALRGAPPHLILAFARLFLRAPFVSVPALASPAALARLLLQICRCGCIPAEDFQDAVLPHAALLAEHRLK